MRSHVIVVGVVFDMGFPLVQMNDPGTRQDDDDIVTDIREEGRERRRRRSKTAGS